VMKNTINVIPSAELQNWKKTGQPLIDAWVSDMNGKGQNGKQMLDGARALIAKHAPK
jgi:TRAP-type transport system periplasmic protein